jgi:thiol-disulfide isomerase/thioredoxin
VYLQQPAQEQPNAPSLPDAAYSQHPQPLEAPARTIPEQLPDISLADREGVRRKLSEWKGRPLVVNFWATWCDPCRREIPLLKSLRRERSAEGIEVIGIAVDFRDAVIRYAHEIGIDYPLLIGEQDALDAIAAFGMDTVFPFTVFADRQGRIVTLKVGELHPDEAHFILDRLRDLDQGRLELAAARQQIAAGIRRLAQERAQAGSPAPPQGT